MAWRMFLLLLTYTHVMARNEQQYDCEEQPEVVNTFEKLTAPLCRNFSSHFMAVKCGHPRPTFVPIASDEPGTQYLPNAVIVNRCVGSCLKQFSCIPTQKKMVSFNVQRITDGKFTCGAVEVEEHVRCKCGCKVMEDQCIPMKQKYDKAGCICRCMNMDEKEECERGDGLWDQKSCKCRCRKEEHCTTGLYWVPSLCKCMGMKNTDPEELD